MDNTKALKSRIAPINLSFNRNHIRFNNKYQRILTIIELPSNFYSGVLSWLVSSGDPDIKVEIETSQSNYSIASLINREVRTMEQEYKNSNTTNKESLRQKMEGLQDYIRELIRRKDKTYNVLINVTLSADTFDDLNEKTKDMAEKLMSYGYKSTVIDFDQKKLMKKTSVWFVNDNFNEDMNYNLGCLMSAQSVAGLYPFIFDTLDDEDGLLLGHELNNFGKIVFDQFYYKNSYEQAKVYNRLNGNMIVIGSTGQGKTTTVNMIMMTHMVNRRKILWIDPENKIRTLIEKTHGSFFNLGTSNARINVFDLKPISSDEDEEVEMYNTRLAIYNVVEDIKIVFGYLYPSIKEETLAIIGDLVVNTYKKVGIDFNTDFRHLNAVDYPTFSHFKTVVDELIYYMQEAKVATNDIQFTAIKDIQNKLQPIVTEYSRYFNGTTTINTDENSNPFIGFGTKIFFNQTDKVRNAIMHIIFQFAWSLCLDETEFSAFCIDEAHLMINEGKTAKMVEQFMRRSRKYNNATIISTQESNDFANEENLSKGKAIFNNACYKIIMKLELNGISDLNKLMHLTDGENNLISELRQGECIMIAGNKRIPVAVRVTPEMLSLMS